jgi:hypothetical protein
MSILTRKVGNREYVYEAHREGPRMVQSYIGPLARPDVHRRMETARRATIIPEHTLRLYADKLTPQLQKDAVSIIACILEHGDLEDLGWLVFAFPVSAIVDVLLSASSGLSERDRNFWSVWFEVRDAS